MFLYVLTFQEHDFAALPDIIVNKSDNIGFALPYIESWLKDDSQMSVEEMASGNADTTATAADANQSDHQLQLDNIRVLQIDVRALNQFTDL